MTHFENELDHVDASVFSGDALADKDTRAHFRRMLKRWEKEVDMWEEVPASEKPEELVENEIGDANDNPNIDNSLVADLMKQYANRVAAEVIEREKWRAEMSCTDPWDLRRTMDRLNSVADGIRARTEQD